jgi:COP9 signalosome complex subunit 1
MGYDDLGRHYHEIGHLTEASKAYAKEREFCLQPSHVSVLTLKFINVHIDQKNWLNVETNVHKLRNLYQKDDDRAKIEPKLHAAMGLALMSTGKYGDAARSFIDTDPRMLQAKLDDPGDGEAYNEVMTPNDVAVYGGLCALATMDRTTLQRLVLDNSNFRSFLELEPHVRRAISFFISGKYSACLSILEAYKTDYLLDVHLSRHVTELYARIHSKAIVQYFVPFSRVTLNALAGAFNTDEQSIESTLADMIGNGTLDARLDLETKTLVATRIDERSKVHDDALVMAKSYERTAQLRILRMEIINAGLEVKSPKAQAPMGTFGPTLTGNYSPEVMAGADGRSKGFNAKF